MGLVFGGSWGSTLGPAYAQRCPERVSEIVLLSIVATTHREVEWVTRDMRQFFPAAWERFRAGVPAEDRDGSLVETYTHVAVAATPSPIPGTPIRGSGCASPGWSPTTGGTRRGWRTAS